MKEEIIVNGITEEMLAAYLDGCATSEECLAILNALPESDELQEILEIAIATERDLALGFNTVEIFPAEAIAATSNTGNRFYRWLVPLRKRNIRASHCVWKSARGTLAR